MTHLAAVRVAMLAGHAAARTESGRAAPCEIILRLTFYATLLSPPYGVTTIRVRCERATSQIEDCRSASMEGTKKVSPAAFRW